MSHFCLQFTIQDRRKRTGSSFQFAIHSCWFPNPLLLEIPEPRATWSQPTRFHCFVEPIRVVFKERLEQRRRKQYISSLDRGRTLGKGGSSSKGNSNYDVVCSVPSWTRLCLSTSPSPVVCWTLWRDEKIIKWHPFCPSRATLVHHIHRWSIRIHPVSSVALKQIINTLNGPTLQRSWSSLSKQEDTQVAQTTDLPICTCGVFCNRFTTIRHQVNLVIN